MPCRLAAVVLHASNEDPFQLEVQCAQKQTGRDSVLFQECHWSQKYSVILPATNEGPCLVVSIKGDSSTILQTKSRYLWLAEFIEPVAERKKAICFKCRTHY
jgi:hypothetical protein